MATRSIIIFITALILLRLGGSRTFGKKTAPDYVVMIMLGAILSRAITGASPFVPTILASAIMVLLHRVLAMIAYNSKKAGKLIKGEEMLLYDRGHIIIDNMKKTQISMHDIMRNSGYKRIKAI